MSAAYSIQCPTCGIEFLASQTRPTSITTCPKCAFNAPLQVFQSTGMTSLGTTSLPVRRRQSPFAQQQPASAPSPPAAIPALFPEIPVATPPATPFHLSSLASPTQPAILAPARPPQPLPESFVPQTEFATLAQSAQKRSSGSFWRTFLGIIAFLAVSSGAIWLVWQSRSIDPTFSAPPVEEIRAAESTSSLPTAPQAGSVSQTPTPVSPEPPSMKQFEQELFAERVFEEGKKIFLDILTQPETRLENIDQIEKVREQVKAFFERHSKLSILSIQKVAVAPFDIQTGKIAPMFQVLTSSSPEVGALVRFQIDPNDRLLLDWPLFEETHEQSLASFVNDSSTSGSRWFSMGLRRSHGLELESSQREIHHVFQIQASPKTLLPVPAIVVRDLPVGRFLNQKTQWRSIHLARLLLRNRTLESGLKCLEIVDCEGMNISQNRTTPPETAPSNNSVPQSVIPGSTK